MAEGECEVGGRGKGGKREGREKGEAGGKSEGGLVRQEPATTAVGRARLFMSNRRNKASDPLLSSAARAVQTAKRANRCGEGKKKKKLSGESSRLERLTDGEELAELRGGLELDARVVRLDAQHHLGEALELRTTIKKGEEGAIGKSRVR